MSEASEEQAEDIKTPTLWQSWMSVLAAFFGVQNSKNRRRDFTKGKASHFIALGVLATLLFIASIMLAVKFALSQAGIE